MNGTVKALVIIVVTLAVLWLLQACSSAPSCEPGGVSIHYYEIDTCFWPVPR